MRKPRALDLFCCQGGAGMGLSLAGFDVVGIDHKPQPRYPFEFIQADCLRPPVNLRDFDFVWASPPCQKHTSLRKMWNARPDDHVDLIPQTREMLEASGVPYAIENVPGAPLRSTIMLCGTMFDLQTPCGAELRRHRYFETSFLMLQPSCRHGFTLGARSRTVGIYGEGCRDASSDSRRHADDIGVTGHGPHNWKRDTRRKHGDVITVTGDSMNCVDKRRTITITGNTPQQNVVRNVERRTYTVDDARAAMGMPWATIAGLSQAIPPAYSEFIGREAMKYIRREAAE